MKAKVVRLDRDGPREGVVTVRVKRAYHNEALDGRHPDLKVGDVVEVKRVVNNPYLVRVKTTSV